MVLDTSAQRHVVKALRLFEAIPYNLLEKFIETKEPNMSDKPKYLLYEMIGDKIINYSTNDKCYRVIQNIPKSIDKICAFAVYLHFARSPEVKVYYADYPFDYIFEDNQRLFQLINYSDEGLYKINFRRNMRIDKEVEPYSLIPVIMQVNGKGNPFNNREFAGDKSYIPKEDYYIANVSYRNNPNGLDDIRVTSVKYKGGTTSEL